MRKTPLVTGEHYHIFSRGVGKQRIFHDERDYARFLFLLLHSQSPEMYLTNISHNVNSYIKRQAFNIKAERVAAIVDARGVELIAFVLMPNHFHAVVRQTLEGGIPAYMQRILTAYAKYYGAKYGHSGHVFQGPYGSVHIADNEQLLHVSAYIHRNPRELNGWRKKEESYPWSSYKDYLSGAEWGGLLRPDIVSGQFKNWKEYRAFVRSSPAKMTAGE